MSQRGRRPTAARSRLRRTLWFILFVGPPLLAVAALGGWLEYRSIDKMLVEKFSGRRWDFPSKVYTDSFAVYPGVPLDDRFEDRLRRLGYQVVRGRPEQRGQYRFTTDPSRLQLYLHAFEYPARREPGRLLEIGLDRSRHVERIRALGGDKSLSSFVLEPTLLTGLHGEIRQDRREMKIDEVPLPLVRAVLAVEDKRFFQHSGIDFRGLARAMLVNLVSGRVRQGGSTLTQQLMKNFFLTKERTISRKIREAAMALVVERRFSKLEILEAYMNEIYMGQRGSVGIYGMWEAAKFYFGREPRELSLGQIATLAGMIRAPNLYSPFTHPERALERRDLVLSLLAEQKEMDARAYRAAVLEPLGTVAPVVPSQSAPYFIDFVRNELKDNYPADVLTTEGFTILTSLDPELQAIALKSVDEGLDNVQRMRAERGLGEQAAGVAGQGARGAAAVTDEGLQAALIAINPRTGAILAMVGGRDYKDSQFNRAVQGRRQPGSVFKPIVMLAALSSERLGGRHFLPTTEVSDAQFTWEYGDGKQWRPANYGDEYYGRVSVREALERSVNTATARIAQQVGIGVVRKLAVRLGIDPKIPAYPAIALGAWEVSPLEMAQVYSVFANSGFLAKPLSVRSVVDRGGRVVEGHPVKIDRRISAADAYMITHLLEGVISRGTGRRVRVLGFDSPAAGKTGTSNDLHDAWFVGYTPDLLCAVWVGYDRETPLGLTGAQAALPIWTEFMKEALRGRRGADFRAPRGVVVRDIDPETGLLASRSCGPGVSVAFLAGEEPLESCYRRGFDPRSIFLFN